MQHRQLVSSLRYILVTGAMGLASSVAWTASLEEVVVTAQHRAQDVQDVPISISALGAEALKKADIFDPEGISNNVPGMAYAEFSPGQAIISMRGISSVDDGAGLDSSTAVFLDGVYVGRIAAINFDMFDLERIEVLRGPQGTLFGRNAIGGAINVVSSKPTDQLSAKVGATGGNEGTFRFQSYISGPLTDSLAGKVVINHREHDGFGENILLGTDTMDQDQTSYRGQLRLSLPRSEWLLSADYMEDERIDMGRTPIANGNFDYLSLLEELGGGPFKSASPIDGFSDREAGGISLQGEIDIGGGTLTSITAFRSTETDWEMPSIGAPAGGNFDLGDPDDPSDDVYGVDVNDDIMEDIETFSQELRFTATPTDRLDYTVGLYFFFEDTDRVEEFKLDFNSAESGQITVGNEYTRTENETTSYAAYGQVNYALTERWKLTLGGRFTIDEKDYVATAVNCDLVADGSTDGTQFEDFAPCLGVGGSLGIIAEAFRAEVDDDWSDFSPMASVQYTLTDETMLFGTISKGFKSGGFAGSQGIEADATRSVDPEEALNYELGFKGDLLDNSLRINATAFFTDYEDLQVVRFGPSSTNPDFGTFQTTNIGTADIFGAELEWTWFASDNFSLSGNYAYLDTEVNDLLLNLVSGPVDASGSDLRQAPENSWNLIAEYTVPVAAGDLDLRLAWSHTDEQINDYIDQRTIIEERDLIDARIGWMSMDGQWELALWGKNLSDEEYVSHSYVIGPGVIGVWGAPRTYGLTLNWTL